MTKPIGFYYDPEKGLYCRSTKLNRKGGAHPSDFKWKEFDQLYPRHQVLIALTTVVELSERVAIKGVVGRQPSKMHRGLYQIFLYGESWRKNA